MRPRDIAEVAANFEESLAAAGREAIVMQSPGFRMMGRKPDHLLVLISALIKERAFAEENGATFKRIASFPVVLLLIQPKFYAWLPRRSDYLRAEPHRRGSLRS